MGELTNKRILVHLWIHETSRQFSDRLLTEGIKKFDDWIKNLYETKLRMQKNSLMPLCELILSELKEKRYKMITDMKLLHKRVNDELESYNLATRSGEKKLVFFTDAINHFCRIARILSLVRGNALLIWLGSSGRQSLAKLVEFTL